MTKYCLTVTCRSTRGIVAAIAAYLAGQGCNITDSAQFDDPETGNFFMRVSFVAETGVGEPALTDGFADTAAAFGMDFAFRDEAQRILSACNTMNRHVLGLSTTRLLCKMESGRLSGGGQGLAEIIVASGRDNRSRGRTRYGI